MKNYRGRGQLVIFEASLSLGSLVGCSVVGVLIGRQYLSCQAHQPISTDCSVVVRLHTHFSREEARIRSSGKDVQFL